MDSDRTLDIIHVVDSLEIGGLERVVADLAVTQQSHGHRVSVFSICHTSGFREALEAAGIPVVVGGKRGALDLKVLRRLRRCVHLNNADVIHTHNFVPNYYAAAALLFSRQKHVLINTCHNMGSRLSNRRLRTLYRWSLRKTARVAMVGRQVHDSLVDNGTVAASRAITVYNGVPVDRFDAGPAQRSHARALLGISDDELLIGCVGRLVELKNHRLLLACMPALLPDHPGLKAAFIGEGPLESDLRAFAEKLGISRQVMFLGARKDVAELLPALDVFALPSRTEGLSIALLEACASGLAVVATAVGGNPEIVRDGVTGLLVGSDDAPALQSALDALLGDEARRQQLGRAAQAWVLENGSAEAMRRNYDQVYASALAD